MACFTKQDIGGCGCACDLKFQLYGCRGAVSGYEVGADLTVEWIQGGSTIYTGTTNSSGLATVSGTPGTYAMKVTDSRATSRWQTLTTAENIVFSCGSTITGSMTTPKTGFHCAYCCGEPLKDTLYATDANGTWTLTYDGSNANGAGWYGCATKTSMANVVTSLPPGTCNPATTGTANTVYTIKLPALVGGVGPCAITNYWGYYTLGGSQRTSSTPTCSAGALNVHANIHPTCDALGAIGQADSGATSLTSTACPPSLSLVTTMPSTGTSSTANPGSGSITITE